MSEQPGAPGVGSGGPERCPSCGARVSPAEQWCSLCLQPLGAGAAPGPGPAQVQGASPEQDPGVPLDEVRPGDGVAVDPAPAGVEQQAEAMLAELAATTSAERPGARGPLAGSSRGLRLALGCGAAVVLVGVLLSVLGLVGLLL
ncbi:hypothetical protein [Aquipuribacter nitratireducens]|uniref:Zinc ribbon domain-containing protein n=1 Tax=Aquipuribacter nitratireducens TaxID=650104 RepID=A0ABW0GQL0_9MICO